jgi:protein-tyrosine phosphatase
MLRGNDHLTEIIPNLFVGDQSARQNKPACSQELAVNPQHLAILDCRSEDKPQPPHCIDYLAITLLCPLHGTAPIPLPPSYNLVQHLPTAVEFINQNLGNNNVLVHCASGKSRSAAIVAGYLCTIGYTVQQAINLIKQHRPIISINQHYINQLNIWYQTINQSSSSSSSSSSSFLLLLLLSTSKATKKNEWD